MSQIILNWLNDQIQLSKRITNFQQDFNNGFLLGQILSKYNQQLNFTQFSNKDDKKSKIKNFELLFDSLSSLGVTFNSLVANQIINKKVGVAKKLLYELKMHLQKTNSNAFTKITKMTKTLSPLKKLKISKEQYDKVDKQHFVKQLNQLHPAQKTLNQQKLLKKFSQFHDQQIVTSNQMMQKQRASKILQQKKFREKQLDNIKKTADFRNQWEKSNTQKWQVNMTVRHMQNQKDNMFKTKLEQTKVQNKTMSQLNAIKAMEKDLNQFERKFLKGSNKKKSASLIEDSDQSEEDNNLSSTKNNQNVTQQPLLMKKQSKLASKLKFTTSNANGQAFAQSSLKKKKLPPQVTQQQKHQRQKKRRKMIVQQNKRYQLIQISRRQKYILSTIQQTSKQQKQLQYEIWRVWQNKQIIKQNKKLVQEKEKDKNETRDINAKFKRDQLLKTYREEHEQEVNESVIRQEKFLQDKKVMDRKKIYGECKVMVDKLIQVSEKCFMHQQQNNQSNINEDLLEHLFSEFIEGAETKEDIAKLEVENYVHGKGEWNIPVKRKTQDIPTDPIQQNALTDKVVNNYALGNILRLLYSNKYKTQKNNSNQQDQTNQINSEYVFSLLGLQFAGKHLVAQHLKSTHNFNIIQIQKLIFRKLQEYESIKDKVVEISQQTKQLVDLAYNGKDIPNQLIVKLVSQEITKNSKSVLINFPTSYNQALELTNILAGVQPSDFIQKSVFQQKIKSFSRLVYPTESKIVQRPIRECGVDLALWIDVDSATSYNRSLGRRFIDGQGVVHINDDIADKVNKLKTGDKASAQIFKNYEKLIQRSKLEMFFNEFGTQFVTQLLLPNESKIIQQNKQQEVQQFRQQTPVSSTAKQEGVNPSSGLQQEQGQKIRTEEKVILQKKVRKAWQKVNGQGSIQEVQKRVLAIIQEVIDAKNLKKVQLQKQSEQKQKQLLLLQQLQKAEQQLKQKCVFTAYQSLKQKTQKALDSVSLPNLFIQQLLSVWQSIQNSTISSLTRVFSFIFTQQSQQQQYFSSTKRNFINLLTREDKKFSIVKDFQIKYNQFFDQNKQMLSQDYTKEELHQRVDDLEDLLFEIIQQKKQDAIQERKTVLQSGWAESQLEQFYNCVRILIQTELNRYNASEKIIFDFYSKRYAVPQTPFEEGQVEINYDTSLEMITKQGTFPRLEKLISEAMRIFNKQQEVVDDKNKKGGKAPQPGKKDDKKGGKKGQVEQVRQPTAQQIQMKRTINIQKSIFRYRLFIINQYSTKKMYSLSKSNQQLSKDLQSYYQYTYDIENKCVFNLSKIFRTKIQRQQKIENQVEVNYVDIIENELIRNFQKEKPVVLSAKEEVREDRFTIANILQILQLVRNQSESYEKISSKRLNSLLKYLKYNQNQKQIFPSTWKNVSQAHLQQFTIRIDSQNLGFVQLWKIFVFFIMTNFSYPSQAQIQEYYNSLTTYGTQNQISKQKFTQTHAWFDQEYEQIENVRTFNRNTHIKKILFDILKSEKTGGQYLDVQNFMSSIHLEWYWTNRDQQKQRSNYFSFAFQ